MVVYSYKLFSCKKDVHNPVCIFLHRARDRAEKERKEKAEKEKTEKAEKEKKEKEEMEQKRNESLKEEQRYNIPIISPSHLYSDCYENTLYH